MLDANRDDSKYNTYVAYQKPMETISNTIPMLCMVKKGGLYEG